MLLMPVMLAYVVDRQVQRRQQASMTARAVPYQPKRDVARDGLLLLFTAMVATAMLAVLGMAVYTSFITFWPYNLAPTLGHYTYTVWPTRAWATPPSTACGLRC